MTITATLVNYYRVCRRKMWLHAHGIRMEHTSDVVAEGKQIGEASYPQRPGKYTELVLEGGKIDFYDAKNRVVHETKKSAAVEQAHIAQVKYYLYLLAQNGIEGATGVIEYPKLRQTETVTFTEQDRLDMESQLAEMRRILKGKACPPRIKKSFCKKCSYFDLCWVEE